MCTKKTFFVRFAAFAICDFRNVKVSNPTNKKQIAKIYWYNSKELKIETKVEQKYATAKRSGWKRNIVDIALELDIVEFRV